MHCCVKLVQILHLAPNLRYEVRDTRNTDDAVSVNTLDGSSKASSPMQYTALPSKLSYPQSYAHTTFNATCVVTYNFGGISGNVSTQRDVQGNGDAGSGWAASAGALLVRVQLEPGYWNQRRDGTERRVGGHGINRRNGFKIRLCVLVVLVQMSANWAVWQL